MTKSDTGGFKDRLRDAIGGDTAYAFARRCGVPESLIRKYLQGDSVPGLEKLAMIADVAQISLDWLVRGVGPMKPSWVGGGGVPESPTPITVTGTEVAQLRAELEALKTEVRVQLREHAEKHTKSPKANAIVFDRTRKV